MKRFRSDLRGRTFGMLRVIEGVPVPRRKTHWLCECECGARVVKRGDHLTSGHTNHCGDHGYRRDSARKSAARMKMSPERRIEIAREGARARARIKRNPARGLEVNRKGNHD